MPQTLDYYKQVLKFRTLPSLEGVTSITDDDALKWVQYKIADEIVNGGNLENQQQIEEKYIKQLKNIVTPYKPPLEEVIVEETPILGLKEYEEEEEVYKPPLNYVSEDRRALYPVVELTEPAPEGETPPYSGEKDSNKFWAFVIFVGIMCLVE